MSSASAVAARRLLAVLVGLLVSLALIVSGAAPASAQNAVGPQPQILILAVGSQAVAAPNSVGLDGLPLRLVSATGVATETAGIVTYEGGGFSTSEYTAASYMAWQGNSVVLRSADPAAGRTSDLLVNGTPYDVYTPTTGNIDRIVSQVASKGSQVRDGGVVIGASC